METISAFEDKDCPVLSHTSRVRSIAFPLSDAWETTGCNGDITETIRASKSSMLPVFIKDFK